MKVAIYVGNKLYKAHGWQGQALHGALGTAGQDGLEETTAAVNAIVGGPMPQANAYKPTDWSCPSNLF